MTNLLLVCSKLTGEDYENIALAMRRYGPPDHPLNKHPHYLKAATAITEIAWSKLELVMAALREAAPTYPEVLDTIAKLQSK